MDKLALISELDKRVSEGLISKVTKGDLAIYCYSPKCVYDKKWDEYTRMARGLIIDLKSGEIVARPFPKFFNLNETPETHLENLPLEDPEITEKMDGSLGILYPDPVTGNYVITTKGTFFSEQGVWATQYFQRKFSHTKLPQGITLLFEIIYPENRIVIDYQGREELVLIGAFDIKTGLDYGYPKLEALAKSTGISLVPRKPLTIKQIMEKTNSLPANEEGFVARYSNGLRIKIKGEEYLKIHRILSKLSLLSIWEALKEGRFDYKFVEKIPEEFRGWTEKTAGILMRTKGRIENEAAGLYGDRPKAGGRKEFAFWVHQQPKQYWSLLFALHDKARKKFEEFVFKMIRPDSNRYQPIHQVIAEDKGEERLERIKDENL